MTWRTVTQADLEAIDEAVGLVTRHAAELLAAAILGTIAICIFL